MSRREARDFALQVLYAKGINPESEPIPTTDSIKLSDKDHAFVDTLTTAVMRDRADIDEKLQRHLHRWTIKELNMVDQNILRMAVAEFSLSEQRRDDKKIIVNEAVELAKKYGEERSSKFINAVLDHTLDVES